MADNITFQSATPATPPNATVVATDDAGAAGHVQIVKLAISTDGSATPVPADATNGIDVDVTRLPALPAGNNNIGDVDVASLPALPTGNNNIGDVDIASMPSLPAGTNNIGDVDIVSMPSLPAGNNNIGDVDIASALPAGDNNIGNVDVVTLPSLPAGTNNIGDVDIASPIPAGDNNIGNVDVVTLPSLPAGNNNIGDVDVVSLPALPAGSNLIGQVNPQPATSGGLSIFRSLDLDETEEEVKGSAGQVYGWYLVNRATSPRYVKFYNDTAANVVVGTTTPVMTLEIPGNSTDHIAANALGGLGIAFSTAITVAATTGLADNDTGAPGANEVVVNIFYK
jgi:hypothetical protein